MQRVVNLIFIEFRLIKIEVLKKFKNKKEEKIYLVLWYVFKVFKS